MINRSESIHELIAALSLAQKDMKAASFDAINPGYKSRYSTLTAVMEACREPLSAHGLAVIQPVSTEGESFTVTTMLLHKSGQWLSSEMNLILDQKKMQALGSAITYARRYGLASLLGIVSDEDDDGNSTNKAPETTEKPVPEVRPKSLKNQAPTLIIGSYVIPVGTWAGRKLSDLSSGDLVILIKKLQELSNPSPEVQTLLQKALTFQAMGQQR